MSKEEKNLSCRLGKCLEIYLAKSADRKTGKLTGRHGVYLLCGSWVFPTLELGLVVILPPMAPL